MLQRSIDVLLRTYDEDLLAKYRTIKQQLTTNVQTRWCGKWPEGNDHGPGHIERVLANLAALLSGDSVERGFVGIYEVFLAATAVVAHDIGIIDGRKCHAERSAELLDLLASKNIFLFDSYSRAILDVAIRCHSSSADIELTCQHLAEVETLHGHRVRPRFVAAIVRLADELDEDHRRAEAWVQPFLPLPPASSPYWEFCQRIAGVAINRNDIVFTVAFEPEDVLRFVAIEGSDERFIRFFAKKLGKINRERELTKRHLGPLGRDSLTVSMRGIAGVSKHTRTFVFSAEHGKSETAEAAAVDDFVRLFSASVDERKARRAAEPTKTVVQSALLANSSIVAIDFGTSQSLIGAFRHGKPIAIPNRLGRKATPSVVAFSPSGEIVVGEPAALQAWNNPDRTVFSVKRRLGTDWQITIDGKDWAAVDIAALIMASLKSDAERFLGEPVSRAVMTVPAYFGLSARRDAYAAATKAGFEVVRMVAEPSAAALALHGGHKWDDQAIVVCDLGGGTFDVSMVVMEDTVDEVIAVNGNVALGGDDFDERIVEYLLRMEQERQGIDLSDNRSARIRLRQEAEKAKVALSGLETFHISVPFLYSDKTGPKHLEAELTRATFEALCKDLVDEMLACCKKLKADGEESLWVSKNPIGELVLVGLSTRIPFVRNALSQFFRLEPRGRVDAEEAVVLGGTIQGAIMDGCFKDFLLLDCIPHTVSVRGADGGLITLIPRNTTIPNRRSETVSTTIDDQQIVEISVYQGEVSSSSQNLLLGKIRLEGIDSAPRGVPQIEVTIDIDANSVLRVWAVDKRTQKKTTAMFHWAARS